jgi:hypothetical protein
MQTNELGIVTKKWPIYIFMIAITKLRKSKNKEEIIGKGHDHSNQQWEGDFWAILKC